MINSNKFNNSFWEHTRLQNLENAKTFQIVLVFVCILFWLDNTPHDKPYVVNYAFNYSNISILFGVIFIIQTLILKLMDHNKKLQNVGLWISLVLVFTFTFCIGYLEVEQENGLVIIALGYIFMAILFSIRGPILIYIFLFNGAIFYYILSLNQAIDMSHHRVPLITLVLLSIFIFRTLEKQRYTAFKSQRLFAQKANENLDKKIDGLNIANEYKSNFLANISHEIRTPLNAIIGFSETMLLGIHGKITEPKYQEYLTDIKTSGEHLSTVINGILDLSKLEAGKWKIAEEEFSLNNCINESVNMLSSLTDEKNIKTTVETNDYDINIMGDNHIFTRIIINLLSNAIKYTEENGEISCRSNKNEDGSVNIEIIDTGIGISADRIKQIFVAFEQGSNAYVANQDGTGLGLPITKKLIELHSGTITITSELNVGTCANIFIPQSRVLN